MKRLFPVLFITCLVFSLLFAAIGVQAKSPVEISYYLWDDPTYRQIVDTFNTSQKEVFVKATYLPAADYETKLLTLLAGGVGMDCYMQKRQADMFPQYANGYIEPLDKLIKKYKFNIAADKKYMSDISIDGKVVAIPFRGAGYFTYYNKKIFEKAGIPTPTEYVKKGEWTWSKFIEVAKKLSTGDGKQYGAIFYTWPVNTFLPAYQQKVNFISANGKIDVDIDSVLFSMRMRRDLEKAKAIIPLAELKATKTHYSQAFYQGNVGMLLIGEWFPQYMLAARDQKLLRDFTWNDWAITRIPCDSPNYITAGASTFNHIYSRSKKKDAAFKFLAWAGGVQGAKVVARNGILPAMVTDDVENELAKVVPDRESVKYLCEQVPVFGAYINKYGTKIETQVLNPLIEKYLVTDMSDGDFMVELDKGLKEVIKSTN